MKFFEKDGEFSKTALILMAAWFIVLVRYAISGFEMFGTLVPTPDGTLTLGILAAASALYFGNHNITSLKTPPAKITPTGSGRSGGGGGGGGGRRTGGGSGRRL